METKLSSRNMQVIERSLPHETFFIEIPPPAGSSVLVANLPSETIGLFTDIDEAIDVANRLILSDKTPSVYIHRMLSFAPALRHPRKTLRLYKQGTKKEGYYVSFNRPFTDNGFRPIKRAAAAGWMKAVGG
jgi:hypothetical protein